MDSCLVTSAMQGQASGAKSDTYIVSEPTHLRHESFNANVPIQMAKKIISNCSIFNTDYSLVVTHSAD